jgi:hypothetical protein
VVVDAVRQSVQMTPGLARRLADRRFGVGCDQVLVVEPPASAAGRRFRLPHLQCRRRRGRAMRQRRPLASPASVFDAGLTDRRETRAPPGVRRPGHASRRMAG